MFPLGVSLFNCSNYPRQLHFRRNLHMTLPSRDDCTLIFIHDRRPGIDSLDCVPGGKDSMGSMSRYGDRLACFYPDDLPVLLEIEHTFQDHGDLLAFMAMAFEPAIGIDLEVGQHGLFEGHSPLPRSGDVIRETKALLGVVTHLMIH